MRIGTAKTQEPPCHEPKLWQRQEILAGQLLAAMLSNSSIADLKNVVRVRCCSEFRLELVEAAYIMASNLIERCHYDNNMVAEAASVAQADIPASGASPERSGATATVRDSASAGDAPGA